MPDHDDEEHKVGERKFNCEKAESPVWRELQNYKKDIKTNGLNGKERRYYQWDHLHNEIEMYDSKRKPIDALDPVTRERLFKNVTRYQPLDI